jgi:hypothetical protein
MMSTSICYSAPMLVIVNGELVVARVRREIRSREST